jgi:hypothetical protein
VSDCAIARMRLCPYFVLIQHCWSLPKRHSRLCPPHEVEQVDCGEGDCLRAREETRGGVGCALQLVSRSFITDIFSPNDGFRLLEIFEQMEYACDPLLVHSSRLYAKYVARMTSFGLRPIDRKLCFCLIHSLASLNRSIHFRYVGSSTSRMMEYCWLRAGDLLSWVFVE